jgi:hypothetical protein
LRKLLLREITPKLSLSGSLFVSANEREEGGDAGMAVRVNWSYTDKKETKFSSYIRKFRWDRVQNHI